MLRPWPECEAMRGVFRLDKASIQRLEDERVDVRRARRRWWWTLPMLPLLAVVPGRLQESWQREWGFPAASATLLSALVELGLAALGVIHLMAEGLGGGGVLPPALSWLGWLSPILLVEAVIRLKHYGAHQEPIGSVIGLPFVLLEPTRSVPDLPVEPDLRRLDESEGVLEFWSPIYRADWNTDGLLRFRDVPYRLDRLDRADGGWLYAFRAVGDEVPREVTWLRLDPISGGSPEGGAEPRTQQESQLGCVATAMITAFACMAPSKLQERWADHLRVRAPLLTVFGAGAEFVGGIVNAGGAFGDGGRWLVVDLFFVAEGFLRFALLILNGRPVGSVLGLAIQPLLERWIVNEE